MIYRCNPAQLDRIVKTQRIRQLDIWLIGPLMIWGGLAISNRERGISKLAGGVLAFFGASTIWYNAQNYRRVQDALSNLSNP